MTELEKEIFQNSEFKPFLWLRYFDEVFDIWTQGSQKLKELFNYINSLHPVIKFTMDYSATEINFLDVTVCVCVCVCVCVYLYSSTVKASFDCKMSKTCLRGTDQ